MRHPAIAAAVLGGAIVLCSGTAAVAAEKDKKVDIGKREYQANCVVCHGYEGKGDGSYADLLKTRAADLTMLSKKNNGVFPFARVYETIDGTLEVKGHGTRDMPVWGTEYRKKAAEYYMDVDYDPQAYTRARILALVEYIYRLQQK